ncbi:hypothetical protein [Serratia sp. Se-RSBMAAmG]|uniref:hypothetical protein n=1 Tax=Serratia sp. Se-RSBMAAmG TaxID=3043305 RepID=UPI0024AFD28B|nr:hypothetical protein [Serratia sp. Se-RSBMAAmG]MDI6976064.1 hypothetical protein [Serratia sp. Se-RSBMAAmG]
MLNYLRRRFFVSDLIDMLKLDYGLNSHPSLAFKYHLMGNILTLTLPSKHQYLLSRLDEEVVLNYDNGTQAVSFNKGITGVEKNGRLIRHLKNCFIFLEKREAFNREVSELSQKMSEMVERHQKHHKSKSRSKDNVLGYIMHHALGCSDDGGGHSHNHNTDSHHSHHHDD